ncbi:MAG: hypothetical protein SFW09_05785 [Hyphomicrobiaceae bacterium]|nr:hypothetical protein [Hyphomicrobiaceae bacterium]
MREDSVSAQGDGGRLGGEAEMLFLLERAGITVPADRVPGMLDIYRDMTAMRALLRRARTAASEPSNVYSLETIMRGDAI